MYTCKEHLRREKVETIWMVDNGAGVVFLHNTLFGSSVWLHSLFVGCVWLSESIAWKVPKDDAVAPHVVVGGRRRH